MSDDFLDQLTAEVDAIAASGDRLERVKRVATRVRLLEAEREAAEEKLKDINLQLKMLTERDLVKFMGEASLTSFSLEAEGNFPPMKFEKVTFYSAKIPEDKEVDAFNWFHEEGHGDLVKTQITVALGMGEREVAESVEKAITEAGADYSSKLTVHPATLKSFVRSEMEAGRPLPVELLGVHVGEVVKLKKGK